MHASGLALCSTEINDHFTVKTDASPLIFMVKRTWETFRHTVPLNHPAYGAVSVLHPFWNWSNSGRNTQPSFAGEDVCGRQTTRDDEGGGGEEGGTSERGAAGFPRQKKKNGRG